MFTDGEPTPDLAAIERRIVALLAEGAGRVPRALERELCSAHRDLPIDERILERARETIEREFEVSLPSTGAPCLAYVRELATFIYGVLAQRAGDSAAAGSASGDERAEADRAEHSEDGPSGDGDGPSGRGELVGWTKLLSGRRPNERRRARVPRARRNA